MLRPDPWDASAAMRDFTSPIRPPARRPYGRGKIAHRSGHVPGVGAQHTPADLPLAFDAVLKWAASHPWVERRHSFSECSHCSVDASLSCVVLHDVLVCMGYDS